MSTWQKVRVGDLVSPVELWVAPDPLPPDIIDLEDMLKQSLSSRSETWCPEEGEMFAFDLEGDGNFCRGVVLSRRELLTSGTASNKDFLVSLRLLDRGSSHTLQFSKNVNQFKRWPQILPIRTLPKQSAIHVVLKDLIPAKRGTDLAATSERAIITSLFDRSSHNEVMELIGKAEAVFIEREGEENKPQSAEIFLLLNDQDNMMYIQLLKNEGVDTEPVASPTTVASNASKGSVEHKFAIVSLRQFLLAKKLAIECRRYQKCRLNLPLAPASLERSVGVTRAPAGIVSSNPFSTSAETSMRYKEIDNETALDLTKKTDGFGQNSQRGDYLRVEQDPEARPVLSVNKLEDVKLISRGLVQAVAAQEETTAYNAERIMWPALARKKSLVCIGKIKRRGYVIPLIQEVLEFRKITNIGNKPSVLIVCPTAEEALEAHSELNARLKYCPELNLKSVIVFQDEERARISMMNDHDVFVTTLSSLVRLISLKFIALDDFRLCVLEDLSSALAHSRSSTIEALMGLNHSDRLIRLAKWEQFVILSNEWNFDVEKFLGRNVFTQKADQKAGPILVFTSPKQSAIQGKIATNIAICGEGEKPSVLFKAATKSWNSMAQKPKKVSICCEKVDLDSVHKSLLSSSLLYDFNINIVVDGEEDDRDVDADFLVHFGVNKNSPAAFFYRYRIMSKYMKSPYASSSSSSSSPRCLLLLGPEDRMAVRTLYHFLKTCSTENVDSNRSFKSLYDFVNEEKKEQMRSLPLCPLLRSDGHCQSEMKKNGDTTCPYRHFLDVNFDLRGVLDLATNTGVELEVTQVVSPVHLRAKIISIKDGAKNDTLEKSRSSLLAQLAVVNPINLVSARNMDFRNQSATSEPLFLCLRREIFHRAAIVPATSRNMRKCEVKVLLIDEGLEVDVVSDSLYFLPENLSESVLPRLSIDTFFIGLKPSGGEQRWNSKWLPLVQKKLLEYFSVATPIHYRAKVEFGLSNSIWIKNLQLIQSYQSGCTICVFDMKKFLTSNENLVAVEDSSCNVVPVLKKLVKQENLQMRDDPPLDALEDRENKICSGNKAEAKVEAIERSPMDRLNESPATSAKKREKKVLWPYPKSATLPELSPECESERRVHVMLSELFDPSHFYVVLAKNMADICQLEMEIRRQCEQLIHLENAKEKIKLGQAMIAKVSYYGEDEDNEDSVEYHRVVILALLDDISAKVQLVDSGHLLTVLRQDLYPLPKEFLKFPCQAIQCSLSNVESDEWSEAAIGIILKEAQNDDEYLTITSASRITPQRQGLANYEVKLLLVDGTDAAETLIERGYARRREVSQPPSVERTNSPPDERIVVETAVSENNSRLDENVEGGGKEESVQLQKSVEFHSVECGSGDDKDSVQHLEKETSQETRQDAQEIEEGVGSYVIDSHMSPQRDCMEADDVSSPTNNAMKSETSRKSPSPEMKIAREFQTSSPPPLAWVIDANNSKLPKTPNLTWYEEKRDGLTIRIEFPDLQSDFFMDNFYLALSTKTICCQYIENKEDRDMTVYAMQLQLFGSVNCEAARWEVNPKGITLKMDKNTKAYWKYLAVYPESGRQYRANWIRRNMDKLAYSDSDDDSRSGCMDNFEYLDKKIANSNWAVPQRRYEGILYSSSSEVDAKSDGTKSDTEDF